MMKRGAIILCGGRSTRMGRPKAVLPFGPELLLNRVLRVLGEVVPLRIVVAAADQVLPGLPSDVVVVRDLQPGRGPLEGLRAGLREGKTQAEAFFVSGCDSPLLLPDFARALLDLLDPGVDAVVPRDADHWHPLSAVYHRRVLPQVEQLLAEDQLRPLFLLRRVCTREVPVEQLRLIDPSLDSLQNVNRPEDYRAALQRAGYDPSVEPSAEFGD
jgi:molybdopterin-guanine dinucleotide biosynthesis protein A